MTSRAGRAAVVACAALVGVVAGVAAKTARDRRPLPASLRPLERGRPQLVDRHGVVLSRHFDAPRNVHDAVPLHAVPESLQRAFVESEDRRFFSHAGVDWRARGRAVLQNLRAGRVVSGASTITEQVVRMLHPRPRSLWSRWLEGIEAAELERRFGKGEILETYLNEVPYARGRRGVVQAAREYFARDLDTLSAKERLALAVLVRSPSRWDPARDAAAVEPAVARLAERMAARGHLSPAVVAGLRDEPLRLEAPRLEVDAPHFAHHVRASIGQRAERRVATTLDGGLQARVQRLLDERVRALAPRGVSDGAALVVDHASGEVLAWVNAGAYDPALPGSQIDAVLAPRQPGSTLKPFLYALALERGWTAATLIDDAPIARPAGHGLHAYRNYGGGFYGPLRLREALGNSLNTPAVRTLRFVGVDAFLRRLRALGLASLARAPGHYGEGLALGSGEVTLLELVRGYATLARGGRGAELVVLRDAPPAGGRRVLDADVAAIIGDVLADPEARRRELGSGLLDLPTPTAVKTGTSSGYHDAWVAGFSDRHTVGVWLGNLDRLPMRGVTGASGPAWVLRAIFAELARRAPPQALRRPRHLLRVPVCMETGALARPACPALGELFRAGRAPTHRCDAHGPSPSRRTARAPAPGGFDLERPTPGLDLALDPRIPDRLERFAFELRAAAPPHRVEWWVDGALVGSTGPGELRYLWPPSAGVHDVHARVWPDAGAAAPLRTQEVRFRVR